MRVTFNQFYISIFLFSLGYLSFLVFDLIFIFFDRDKKIVKILIPILEFVLLTFLSVLYVYFSFILKFPTIRVYMPFAFFVGVFLERKSFYLILANLRLKLYNKRSKKGEL